MQKIDCIFARGWYSFLISKSDSFENFPLVMVLELFKKKKVKKETAIGNH